MDVKKNDIVQVEIEDIGESGEGIGKLDGYTLFIKDAVIGDVIEAKIMKAKKHYAYARLERVITPSPFRVEPRCSFHRQCGGCQIQVLSYEKQLEFKQNKVKNNLIRIGGLAPERVEGLMEAPVGMEEPFFYRNKAQFPFGKDKEGNIVTGFYAGRTHSIIANTDCALGVKENQLILEKILRFMKEKEILPYDEERHHGLVRHVLIRKGFFTGQLMVCLVVNGNSLPHAEDLVKSLTEIPGMISISISINREKTNVIMGKEIRLLYGKEQIEDSIGGLTFKISPLSFYQVNPVQTEKIYQRALEYAALTGEETVWDLYCGIGTISLFLAGKARQVYGVEIIPEAIRDAKENARINRIENVKFFVGKAEEVLPDQYEKEGIYADVIVVDPPRKGCDEACLSTMVKMQPKRIVYVSCDSATLARDVKYLEEHGYELKKAGIFDNFPQSVHVETVVLLSKGEVDSKKIRVEFSLEDMDMSEFQDGATYPQIKEYVLEHTGLKVSNLYISQIKRKCGIEVGKNYNLPKSEDSRQPQCPPEKEKAIREAFKYFGMI
ncbi:MAG: 23S rRNA (uracil(1939)-C(5))-methyltransferase RlmD [Lachnospiraceae bacterium]|nr:23S rRNA (uracil(1939)-C(5))-methyltransferase RlmD [Lachnospiraceae bacterium]